MGESFGIDRNKRNILTNSSINLRGSPHTFSCAPVSNEAEELSTDSASAAISCLNRTDIVSSVANLWASTRAPSRALAEERTWYHASGIVSNK